MRVYATIVALVGAATIVGMGSSRAFADTTKTAGTTKPAQNLITVQSGDTLSAIAADHGSTYVRIFDANAQISNPNLIYPEEVLSIPASNAQLPDRPLPTVQQAAPVNTDDSEAAPSAAPSASTPAPASVQPAVGEPAQPAQPQQTTTQAPAISNGSVWDELAQCESGGDWSINTGNGFYGGLQFTLSSWQAVGGIGYPNQASQQEQIMRAEILQSEQGWGAWPVCSAKIGL